MTISFNELCKQLNIKSEQNNEEQLQKLEQWCRNHISTDISFSGSLDDKTNGYRELARSFYDDFSAKIPQDIRQAPKFDKMNAIQYAASQGYDCYLSTLTLPQEVWDEANNLGMTALHSAATNGHVNSVDVLLGKGANPDIKNRNGDVPLFRALFLPTVHKKELIERKEKIFRLLKDKAPETIKHKASDGNTILQFMIAQGFYNLVNELLAETPDMALIPNKFTVYPIHTAILTNHPKIVESLLKIDKVAEKTDKDGKTALHYAAQYGTPELIELCCAQSKNIDVRDHTQKTPLMLAAEAGRVELVKKLFEKKAKIELTDAQGYSVLHYAILSKNPKVVTWLLENSTLEINQMDHDGLALQLSEHDTMIHAMLKDKGAKASALRH